MAIIKRELILFFRDWGSIFFCMIFPLVLTGMLGTLLESLNVSDYAAGNLTLQYVGIPEEYLPAIDGVTFVKADNFNTAKDAVKDKKADAAVSFSADGIDLYKGGDSVKSGVAEMIFRSVSLNGNSGTVDNSTYVKTKELGYNRSMMDYYAVAMIVMILFMGGAIGGAGAFYESRKDGTLRRAAISPKTRTALYLESLLSFLPQNIFQIVCTMIPAVLIFHAHYADTFAENLLLFAMFFVVGAAIMALFGLVGLLSNINPTLIIMPVMWALLFCSGTFSQSVLVSEKLPPALIQAAAFDLTIFGRYDKCLAVMCVCAVIIILSVITGTLLFGRKEVTAK